MAEGAAESRAEETQPFYFWRAEMKKKFYEWQWKTGDRNYWTVTATDSGERQKVQGLHSDKDEGNIEWYYKVYVDDGSHKDGLYVHSGLLAGQEDEPPKLRLILQDWLVAVAGVVVDGAVHGQEVE